MFNAPAICRGPVEPLINKSQVFMNLQKSMMPVLDSCTACGISCSFSDSAAAWFSSPGPAVIIKKTSLPVASFFASSAYCATVRLMAEPPVPGCMMTILFSSVMA